MEISWTEKKHKLCMLIKKVSDKHGGDDMEWLKEYAKEVVERYKNDLETAIKCFEDLAAQI